MTGKGAVSLLIAWVLCVSAARATVLVPADLPELSRDAGLIVRGEIESVESRWTEGRRAIETVVTLRVDATLKGSVNPTVQWIVPGGTIGRFRRLVIGAPEFAVGEHVIVFLGGRAPGFPYLIGFGQGVFRVLATGTATEWIVVPPPVGATVAAAPVVRGDVGRRPVPLALFEQQIRSMVAGQR